MPYTRDAEGNEFWTPDPGPSPPRLDPNKLYRSTDPAWSDPYFGSSDRYGLNDYWGRVLPSFGFKGPLYVGDPNAGTGAVYYDDSGGVQSYGPAPTYSPEAEAAINKLKAAGYDMGVYFKGGDPNDPAYRLVGPNEEILANFDQPSVWKQGIRMAVPLVLSALGAPALGAYLAPAASAATQAALGSAVLSGTGTALTGGDVEDVLKSAALGGAGAYIAPNITSAIPETGISALDTALKSGAMGAFRSGIGALASGQDPLEAAISGGITGGVTGGVGAMGAEYLQDLPAPLQKAVASAVASEILGGDTQRSVINSLVGSLPGYIKEQITAPSSGEEGFFAPGGAGYDSWGMQEHVFDPTFGGALPLPRPFFPEFEEPLLVAPPATVAPSPAPALAAQSGANTAAILAMLAAMGFKEDENALAPLLGVAALEDILTPKEKEEQEKEQKRIASPFGMMPYA